MTNMINLDCIYFLRRTDNFLLFAMNDLSIEKSYLQIDYLQILSRFRLNFNRDPSRFPSEDTINEIEDEEQKRYLQEQIHGINSSNSRKIVPYYEDMENLLCGIPQTIKFTDKNKTYYFYFIVNANAVLICVSNEFDDSLRSDLIPISRCFEQEFPVDKITKASDILYSEKIIFSFIENLTKKVINRYYIPHIPHFLYPSNSVTHLLVQNSINDDKKIYNEIKPFYDYLSHSKRNNISVYERLSVEIDGISDIKSIAETTQLDINELSQIMVFLWIKGHIIFRIPIFGWNIFERTHKSNEFLLDGSESQKELLNFYGGGKIISLLSRFDGRSTIAEIQKKMNINELRYMRYVYDLLDMDLIQKAEIYPVLRHIGQEIVPLLVIQGLKQKDLKIIEELESQFDGSKSITSVALKMDESPEKIKQILDKIPEFVQYNTI